MGINLRDTRDIKNFIKSYMEGNSYDEIAKNMGVKKPTVQALVYRMRRFGVNLPKKQTKLELAKTDVEELNIYIKRLETEIAKMKAEELAKK